MCQYKRICDDLGGLLIMFSDFNKERLYLADQYYNVTKNLLFNMIDSGNPFSLVSALESTEEMLNEHTKHSSFRVILPLLFCFYQGTELLLKAFVLEKNNIKYRHSIEDILKDFKKLYPCEGVIIDTLDKYLGKNKIGFIDNFCKVNNLTSLNEIYNALRYPDHMDKLVDYMNLEYSPHEFFLIELSEMMSDIDKLMLNCARLFRKMEDEID
jgi:hypothetical protein